MFGVDKGKIHLFGTDGTGKDIFSRNFHSINTSLAVGHDRCAHRLCAGADYRRYLRLLRRLDRFDSADDHRCGANGAGDPAVHGDRGVYPGYGELGRAIFLIISIILGFIGWPTLARRVRTHLLTERNQEYVLAAQLLRCLARPYYRAPSAPELYQLYHRRPDHFVSVHGVVRNRAELSSAWA